MMLFSKLAVDIAGMPLRKPAAAFCILFVMLTTWSVILAAILGHVLPGEVLEFVKWVMGALVVPVIGYYFSSTVEDGRHRRDRGGEGVDR